MSPTTLRAASWLVAASLLALGLRLAALNDIPPGLHHDEALNALEARDLLESGERPIYLGSGFNGEPILEYSMMLSEARFGMTPFAVRLPSALYGALTVPLVYALMLVLALLDGTAAAAHAAHAGRTETAPAQRNALIAAFVLATLYWHLNASREGYKPILLPLFGALTFLLLMPALRLDGAPRDWKRWLLPAGAGAALGAGFYTYPSIRFLYPVAAIYAGMVVWSDRARWRAYAARLALTGAVALLIFAPLGIYYLQHPGAFFTRSDQVAIWATRPGHVGEALVENSAKVAGMFFFAGDENPRHNLPGRPALDPILAAGFVAGLGVALRRWRRPHYAILPIWLAAMVIPSIVTEAAPNFLRSLGATVPAAALIALGWGTAIDRVGQYLDKAGLPRAARIGAAVLAAALLLISAALSLNTYFNVFPRDPRMWYAFDVGLMRIGETARALPRDERIYLTPFDSGQETIRFALGEPRSNLKWFDGRKCLVAPPPDRPASYLIVSEDFRTLGHLRDYWASGQVVQQIDDYEGKPYLTHFRAPARAWDNTPKVTANASFGGELHLAGYSVLAERVEAGQGVPVVLFWRALRPPAKEYTIFAHLLGSENPRTGTPLWGQQDGPPCAGGYPTTRWEPGETITHDFLVVVDKLAPAGSYRLVVGIYELAGGTTPGARLHLPDGADQLPIGAVEIFRR